MSEQQKVKPRYPTEYKGIPVPETQADIRELTAAQKYALDLLHQEELTFKEASDALFECLERLPNIDNCFWISHAWALSLMYGKTISVTNFPWSGMMELRQDPEWKKTDTDSYRGSYLAQGAEQGIFIKMTKGVSEQLRPTNYEHMESYANLAELRQRLTQLENGSACLVLLSRDQNSGHAFLLARLNSMIIVIDSSMQPGPWVSNWNQQIIDSSGVMSTGTWSKFYAQNWSSCHLYVYPHKIHGFQDDQVQVSCFADAEEPESDEDNGASQDYVKPTIPEDLSGLPSWLFG